jgi:folate-binding protein YgfZ
MNVLAQQETPATLDHQQLRTELHALAAGCGTRQLDRAFVSLAGKDRVRWLNGMVSNNIRDLAAGRGVYAFVLNPQGNIQGDLYAFSRGESLMLEFEAAQFPTLFPLLRRYIIMDKVEVTELGDTLTVFEIKGPKSDEVLQALGIALPDSTALALLEVNWNGITISVIRGDNPCVPSYEFWVAKEQAEAFRKAVLDVGAYDVHAEATETFRILCGIPKVGADIRERTLPQETGQERALNFNKGCYIGQEIVERIRARGAVHRVLTGFAVDDTPPAAGTAITVQNKEVGQITSTASVPVQRGHQGVALGYIRREQLNEATEFDAAGTKVRPVPLPFTNILQQL